MQIAMYSVHCETDNVASKNHNRRMRISRRISGITLPLLAAALLLASCSSSGENGSGTSGSLIFGTPDGIVEYTIESGETRVLVPAPSPTDTLSDPGVSPDGSLIAYSYAPRLRRVNGVLEANSDLWLANRDGSESRMIYRHWRASEAMSSVRWLDDETILVVTRYPVDPMDVERGRLSELSRVDIKTGVRTKAVANVVAFDVSRDRKNIAYVAAASVFVGTLDGAKPKQLVDTASSGLNGIVNPIFSPDGKAIYFGAHEEAPATEPAASRGGTMAAPAGHTAPDDIWRIPVGGGTPTLVAETDLFEPSLAVSDDGDEIYALSGDLYVIPAGSEKGELLVEAEAFSRIDYVE
jgi:Tol biopolymer transport system component